MAWTAKIIAALLAAVGISSISGAVWAVDGRVGYSWRLSSGDGRIDKTQPETFETVPLDLFGPAPTVSRSDSVDLTLPAQTSADVSLSGKVDLLGRGLGVSVTAHAKVNPYDPDSNTLDPILVTAEAAVETSFVDRVIMLDPTCLPGTPIRFEVQPLRTRGRMDVPREFPMSASGVAIFQIHFALENVIGGASAPYLLNYEQILLSGSSTEASHWDTNGLVWLSNLGGGPITVPNGSVWDVSFTIRAAVQALPSMLPASNPHGALSEASFLNTVYWGGLQNIVNEQGDPLPNFELQSELGFDWVSSVPEPSQTVLLLAGVVLIGLRRRFAGHRDPGARHGRNLAAETLAPPPRRPGIKS